MFAHSNIGISSLPSTVIRIRAGSRKDGSITHTGTGFFYFARSGGLQIPFVVSNKHVICDTSWIELDFALQDSQQTRLLGPPKIVRIPDGEESIFEHPDPDVDLAIFPIQRVFNFLSERGTPPYAMLINSENFVPEEIQSRLNAATNVLMVGFPNGIMDERNNLPVVRRGILATPYYADYEGKTDFVVDIAAFGGSSGSPVFAFFENAVPTGKGVMITPSPVSYFIGVLHSGPVMSADGEIVAAPAPTGDFISKTALMIHLGYCVKASRLEELAQIAMKELMKMTRGSAQ